MNNNKSQKTPNYLKLYGGKFYRGVLSDYEISETHDLQLLAEASACIDRVYESRAEIEKAGAFFRDRFGQPREHPAHKTERDNKILFARLLRELNLDIEIPANRPPKRY